MRTQLPVLVLCCLALSGTLPVQAQSSRGTILALTVVPECSIEIVSLSPGESNSQTVTFNYKLRTAGAGGRGQIILRFTATNSNNSSDGSRVDFQTSLAGPGTPASGSISTANALNSGIVIARFGSQTHSIRNGATGTVQFTQTPAPTNLLGALEPSLSISCQ